MKNLPAKLKFCVQILAALIVIFSGTRIQVVLWPVTAYLQKFSIPITLVWIVGVTNAVNLIDGLDGLAGRGYLHCGNEPDGALHYDR